MKLSISTKLIAIVTLPLCIQLAALLLVSHLQREAEADLTNAVRAKKIADALNVVDNDIYSMISSHWEKGELDSATLPLTLLNWHRHVNQDFNALSLLCAGQPSLIARVNNIRKNTKEAIALVGGIQQSFAETGESGRVDRKPSWRQLRRIFNDSVLVELATFNGQVQSVIKRSPEVQTKLRVQQQQLMICAAVLNLLLTVVLGIYLTRRIALRLETLGDNAIRFSHQLPLLPNVGGSDEIAAVDQTFREMARKVSDSVKRETMLLDNAVAIICSINEEQRFTAANSRAGHILGYESSSLLELKLGDVITDEAATSFLQRVKAAGTTYSQEFVVADRGGHKMDTLWTAQWSVVDKQFFCVIQDISGQREAERLKSRLHAMLTHDLKTPLMTVDTALKVLIREQTPIGVPEDCLLLAARNVARLTNLVANFLDYEKISTGGMPVILDFVALGECFEMVKDITAGIKPEGITLVIAETDLAVKADFELVSRVVTNLVSNALKYAPANSEVSLSATKVGGMAQVCVADNGPGIRPELLEKIFDDYYQIDQESKKQGHGLGLAIAKYLAELQGGSLEVSSQLGQGTRFFVSLPLWPDASVD